jgi:hypothetical protein
MGALRRREAADSERLGSVLPPDLRLKQSYKEGVPLAEGVFSTSS